jgi:hypothetical protein
VNDDPVAKITPEGEEFLVPPDELCRDDLGKTVDALTVKARAAASAVDAALAALREVDEARAAMVARAKRPHVPVGPTSALTYCETCGLPSRKWTEFCCGEWIER